MEENQDVNSSLITAVREGNLEKAKELILCFGLSHSPAWSEGYVLLRDALAYQHVAVAKLLLESGSEVNSKDLFPTHTPLHFAVKNDHIEIVKMILDRGADINAKNISGITPLYYAIENENNEVTELLLKYHADVNASDNYGISLLYAAIKKGCLQIVEHLLRHGTDVNCVFTGELLKSYALLHCAAKYGNKEIITLLLSKGANVDIKDEDNITPLHFAAISEFIDIAEDLLNHGACIHSRTLREGYTPLHFASRRDNGEAVKFYLNKGADINAITNDNSTPLHIATQSGSKTVVKLLLERGSKVDHQDKDGNTTLHLAVKLGYSTIVEDLLKYCPDINNQSNKSSLKIAVKGYRKEYQKIVEALLEYGFIVDPEDANNPDFLHVAVEHGCLKIVEYLLKNGADIHTTKCHDFNSFTPLHSAAYNEQAEVAELLISYGADLNAQDRHGKTPIFYAIENADLKITNLLFTNEANIEDPNLLTIAVQKGCIEIVEALLQRDVDINASDEYGRTALHFTVLCGYIQDINIQVEIAKLLLSRGANVDAQTKDGVTILHDAILNRRREVVEVLLKHNANVNSRAVWGGTPLTSSVEHRDVEMITMLLNKGANVNAKQEYGKTVLHLAAEIGHEEILELLLECGAEVDAKMGITPLHGKTALYLASQIGHLNVVVTLLEYGSDVDITSLNNQPLSYAFNTAEALKRHVVKLKTANLYVSETNLLLMHSSDEMSDFQDECEDEIASMKREKIDNLNISFYDILAKSTSSLALSLRNENIVQILKSGDYKTKFPIYASKIKNHFRKGMERKELLEQGNKIFHSLFKNFPELPSDCTEKILSYLSNEDLRSLLDACKPLNISNPNANINDMITFQEPQSVQVKKK